MPVMVTGGSGVLGMHAVEAFARQGETVVALSTSGRPKHAEVMLAGVMDRVQFVAGDIRDYDRLSETVSQHAVDGIVHTAALTGEAQARSRSREVIAVNVDGTVNVFEVARQASLRRVVYVGSASEYGRREDLAPISEDEINPEGLYAETKYIGHRLGQRYKHVFGLDVVTARVSSVYGPHTRFNELRGLVGNPLIALLCRSAARGEPLRLEGGGDYPRGWTYAADAAEGLRLLYEKEDPAFDAYNIASGESYRLHEVISQLHEIEPDADVEVTSGTWDDNPFQAGNFRGPLDIARASEDLEFKPAYSLKAGTPKVHRLVESSRTRLMVIHGGAAAGA